ITNGTLPMPLTYTNQQFELLTYLVPLTATTIRTDENDQVIEFIAKNTQLLTQIKKILLLIYLTLFITSIFINIIYYRLFKQIERSIVQEICNDDAPGNPFIQVTEQLRKLKNTFDCVLQNQEKEILSLAEQANMDTLTGLNNRHAFRKELTGILNKKAGQKNAILFVIRASELNTINSQRGFQQGDEYIISIAKILLKAASRRVSASVYRICGSDFAIIGREMNITDAQSIAKEIKIQFDQYQGINKLESVAYSGISAIISEQLPEQVLARADMALAKAQTEGGNSWVFEQNDTNEEPYGQQKWQEIIEGIIAKRALMLLHQPIQAVHRNMTGYQQIFTRFIAENNKTIPSDTVFAMAQRIDMTVKIEQLIIETVISQCRNRTESRDRWGINISSSAMQNNAFIIWLERLLLRESHIASSLIFEMQEAVLDSNLVASKRIFDLLKRTGTHSAICNFGKGIGSFRLFKDLRPDFVKIDPSLIINLERDSANQQFIRMIIDVAHRMDCCVIAESIEYLEQKQILENMYIDGVQGFFIARPSPL
ncbi:EAL domain-containing protein, partial [Psychromonas antarctica]|uniref:EAL domain-containing protein n=1 Tax=Psychromonas antarctica TaxID=67573 RepID=UPI001EE791B4